MNMQTSAVMAPPPPRGLVEMQLPLVMMRDILLKTVFRKNVEKTSDIARAIALPLPLTQELIDGLPAVVPYPRDGGRNPLTFPT